MLHIHRKNWSRMLFPDVSKYKTSVVLLHDSEDRSTTVEAVGPLIEALQDMDAEILPIDEDTQVIQYVKADSAR
ncbi:MAG: hypothetical protein ACLR78_14650 [Roseburia sp.]